MWTLTPHLRCCFSAALVAASLICAAGTAHAQSLNCVQFVQRATTLGLHGDAYQWWDAANGQYTRGRQPKTGAVIVFSKSGILPHGHVAVVRNQRDKRTIIVDHANWSPINGHRGQVEKAVKIVDVSKSNDWSRVRVWYHPTSDIGQTVYPVKGFVYAPVPRHHAR
ncbi:CHAP domain-containing protein [Telmatospirillum sp.]|uniref:CHAP domain-containing protein n=1 Tax=Telmatospirillum sp. TaxID=2079197 RepID=UPI00284A792F|nr:CHAP domain-containing protein [Telmatospirillum sp.]MDR3438819.1 CHAP domain-containing protein [Telmatospirillum sp.]